MSTAAEQRWPLKRIRFLVRRELSEEQRALSAEAQATFLPMTNIGENGEINCSIVRDIADVRDGYTRFFDGDVLIAKITPCFENGKGALVRGTASGVGFGTTELHVLSPGSEIDARYLYYVTASERFRKLGEAAMSGAAGQKRVPDDFVRNYRVPIPPLAQQRSIADYLDQQTARIDELAAVKRRLLELLDEKQRAIIAKSVGVRKGSLPAVRLKYSVALRSEPVLDGAERPYIGLADIRSYTGELAINRSGNCSEAQGGPTGNAFEVGDVLFCKLRPYLAKVWIADFAGQCTTEALVLSPKSVEPRFLKYNLLSPAFVDEVTASTFGSKMPRAEWSSIGSIPIWTPDWATQCAIADFLDAELTSLRSVEERVEKTLIFLVERRSALISGAVSGRIAVRDGRVVE